MAKSARERAEFHENPLIAELIARGAENSRVLRGFIGPSTDRHITLYQDLARLSDTVEIPREDVYHIVDAPGSGLGAVMLWVKSDADIRVRRPQVESQSGTAADSSREVSKGRLRMQVRPASGADVCTSRCDICVSYCVCLME